MSNNFNHCPIRDPMNQCACNSIRDPYGIDAQDLMRQGGIGTSTKPGRYWISAVVFFLLFILGIFLLF